MTIFHPIVTYFPVLMLVTSMLPKYVASFGRNVAPALVLRRCPSNSRCFRYNEKLPVSEKKFKSSLTSRFMSSTKDINTPDAPAEKTEEEKAALKAAREARKAEKERKKTEKKAKKEADRLAKEKAEQIHDVNYLSYKEQDTYEPFGDLTRVMSRSRTDRDFAAVQDLTAKFSSGDTVWLRGRLHSIRIKGGSCFLVLRQDSFNTVQAVFFKDKEKPEYSRKMIKYLKSLTEESVIDIEGSLESADVKSCSVQNVEIKIQRIHSVAKAASILPFLVEDAARSETEVDASQDTDRPFPRLGQDLRLSNRWMDLVGFSIVQCKL